MKRKPAANADSLGVDLTRIGFWACSGQGSPVFLALQDQDQPYREAFKAAALTYLDLTTADPGLWPKGISLFVVKAGKDFNIQPETIDYFVAQARASNLETEYIELTNAPHAYDIYQDNQISRDTVKQTVEFLQSKLLP